MTQNRAKSDPEKPPKPARGKTLTHATDGAEQKPAPRRKFALTSLRAVRREMGVTYWQARNGEISMADAARLTFILSSIGRVLVDAELEARVLALELEITRRQS